MYIQSEHIKDITRLKEEPIWYDPDAMSVNSSPTSPETERKKKESTSMGSDRGDKEFFISYNLYDINYIIYYTV